MQIAVVRLFVQVTIVDKTKNLIVVQFSVSQTLETHQHIN